MKNLNACLASLNLGLPDDVRRLKEAGYYTEAIACIDTWRRTGQRPRTSRCSLPALCRKTPRPAGWTPCGMHCWPSGRSCAVCRWTIRCPKHRRWNCCRTLCGTLPRRNSGHWTRPVPWTGGSWKGRSGTSAPLPRPCWPLIRSWQPVRSTRPSSTPAGSGMSRSTSRWCAPAQSARTSRWKPASA